jgi:DNA polymerase-3 subunit delta
MTASQGPAARLHLLVGDEAFLRDQRARELIAASRPEENADYNQETFSGPEIDLDQVVNACDMLPVNARRRLVVIRHLDWKAAAAHPRFVAYLRRPNPTTVLIVVADPAAAKRGDAGQDEERPSAKAKKAVTQKELVALFERREEFPALKFDEAADFVRRAARERGVELGADVARELVELVGTDTARLDDEIEKAALFTAARGRIELADIEALARRTRHHTMFELTDAIARADREAVLAHLHALLEDGAEPVVLVGMIAWHLRRTLLGAALLEAGRSPADAARAAGVWKFADRFAAAARKLGTVGVARAMRGLRDADRRIKSTAEDERIILERTLLELVG